MGFLKTLSNEYWNMIFCVSTYVRLGQEVLALSSFNLFARTVPATKNEFARTVPATKNEFARTVPANNKKNSLHHLVVSPIWCGTKSVAILKIGD